MLIKHNLNWLNKEFLRAKYCPLFTSLITLLIPTNSTTLQRTKSAFNKIFHWLSPPCCLLCLSPINSDGKQIKTIYTCNLCTNSLPTTLNTCEKCGETLANNIDNICGSCVSSPPAWNRLYASYEYKLAIREIVARAKFQEKHTYCKIIAQLMLLSVKQNDKQLLLNTSYLIPTPSHRSRLNERGYNQALYITKELSKLTRVPILDCLEKNAKTAPQSSLSKKQRKSAVLRFTIRKGTSKNYSLYKGKSVIVVDDVLTTGSTALQMTKTLNTIGFSTINIWVFARA